MRTMTYSRRALALLAGSLLSLAACSEEDVPTGVTPTDEAGRVRFVHAIADPARADRVDVTVDGVPLTAGMAYGTGAPLLAAATPAYYPVYVGARSLKVVRTTNTSLQLLDQALTIADDTDYTVMAVGNATAIQGVVLTDANAAPAAGSSKIRAVHGSASTGNVDVYITSTTADITAINPTVANLAPRTATVYQTVTAGTYRVRFTTAGTKTVILDVNNVALASLQVRSVFALDRAAGGAPLTSLTLTDR
jgi:hypothetical protein